MHPYKVFVFKARSKGDWTNPTVFSFSLNEPFLGHSSLRALKILSVHALSAINRVLEDLGEDWVIHGVDVDGNTGYMCFQALFRFVGEDEKSNDEDDKTDSSEGSGDEVEEYVEVRRGRRGKHGRRDKNWADESSPEPES